MHYTSGRLTYPFVSGHWWTPSSVSHSVPLKRQAVIFAAGYSRLIASPPTHQPPPSCTNTSMKSSTCHSSRTFAAAIHLTLVLWETGNHCHIDTRGNDDEFANEDSQTDGGIEEYKFVFRYPHWLIPRRSGKTTVGGETNSNSKRQCTKCRRAMKSVGGFGCFPQWLYMARVWLRLEAMAACKGGDSVLVVKG